MRISMVYLVLYLSSFMRKQRLIRGPNTTSMAVGTGGGGGRGHLPNILPTQKIQEYKKQRHINQCIEIWLKYVHSSVDIGNHRYTNVQNCILLKYKCDKKCPPPNPKIVPTT